jgi:hypothetical protein
MDISVLFCVPVTQTLLGVFDVCELACVLSSPLTPSEVRCEV